MIGNEKTNTQVIIQPKYQNIKNQSLNYYCLLYTSDAADE